MPTPDMDFPEYTNIQKLVLANQSSVLLMNDKHAGLGSYGDQVDMEIFHPRTEHINGRAAWYTHAPDMRPISVDVEIPAGNAMAVISVVPVDRTEKTLHFDRLLVTQDGPITLFAPIDTDVELIGVATPATIPNLPNG